MPRQVTVELFGKRGGYRQTEVTARGGMPTRHIRTRLPQQQPAKPIITPKAPAPKPTPKPDPVLPAFNSAWRDNRRRVLDYLGKGFYGNISDGVLLHELGTAIEAEYAPRKSMTPVQWKALTAELEKQKWSWGDFIHRTAREIYQKHDGYRYAHLQPYPEFTPPADETGEGEPAKVFIEIHTPKSKDYPKKLLWNGTKALTFDTYAQAYANDNDQTILVETANGKKWFMHERHYRERRGGCTVCGSHTCSGVGSTGIRCSRKRETA